jgi:serine/threonine protein kinase
MSKNCQDACAVLETKEECISRQKSEIVAPRTGSAECTGNMFTREVTFDDLFREKFIPLDSRKKVGNYVIGRVIGEGTFSKVREARNITNSEKVILLSLTL